VSSTVGQQRRAAPGGTGDGHDGGSRPVPDPRWLAALRALAAVGAAVAVGTYLWVALRRIGSPGELEWMEGGMVDLTRRAMTGESLYVEPSLDAIPYLYTPLYYYVSGLLSLVVGEGFLPLRLVSFVASLGAFAAVAGLVVTEVRDRWAGWIAAGVLAASYGITAWWFDVGRIDSLFLALTLAGLLLARRATTSAAVVGAAAVLVLAVLTKQQAALPALSVLPWLWWRERRFALWFVAAFGAGCALTLGALQLTSGGWFTYYAVELPRSHAWVHELWVGFWRDDLRPYWPTALAALVVVVALVRRGRVRSVWRPQFGWFWVPVGGAMVVNAWFARLHSGGFENVLLPVCALAAVGAGSVAGSTRRPELSVAVRGAVCVLVALQFVTLWRAPTGQVPGSVARERAEVLVEELRTLPGPVYLPGHGWYLRAAGRGEDTTAQGAAIADILRGPPGAALAGLREELRRSVEEQRWASVVVDSDPGYSMLPPDFERFYRFERDLLPGGRAVLPVLGTITGPAEVWVPRSEPLPEAP
jgi:hypothetical protein